MKTKSIPSATIGPITPGIKVKMMKSFRHKKKQVTNWPPKVSSPVDLFAKWVLSMTLLETTSMNKRKALSPFHKELGNTLWSKTKKWIYVQKITRKSSFFPKLI